MPIATSAPRSMKARREQRSISSRWCDVTTSVRPSPASRCRRSKSARRWPKSTPAVGSSRNTTRGRCRSAKRIASRCRAPAGSARADAACRPRRARATARTRRAATAARRPDSIDARVELDVLRHAQVRVERYLLGDVADAGARGGRMAHDVDAVDHDAARARREEAGQHADRRRLAAAVRAEEPEDLACRDRERETVDRGEGSEAAHEVVADDGVARGRHGRALWAIAPDAGGAIEGAASGAGASASNAVSRSTSSAASSQPSRGTPRLVSRAATSACSRRVSRRRPRGGRLDALDAEAAERRLRARCNAHAARRELAQREREHVDRRGVRRSACGDPVATARPPAM